MKLSDAKLLLRVDSMPDPGLALAPLPCYSVSRDNMKTPLKRVSGDTEQLPHVAYMAR